MDSGYINTYYRAGGSNPNNGSTNYPSLQAFPSSSAAGQAQTSCTTTVLPVSGGSTNMGPMSLLSLNISHNPKPTLTNSHSQTNLSALTSSQLPLQVFRNGSGSSAGTSGSRDQSPTYQNWSQHQGFTHNNNNHNVEASKKSASDCTSSTECSEDSDRH